MKSILSSLFICFLFVSVYAQNQAPQIQNVQAAFSLVNNRLTVVYDLNDAENDSLEVRLLISEDEGKSFRNVSKEAIGEVGFPLFEGSAKAIYWDSPQPIFWVNSRIKLVVDDRQPVDIQGIVDQVDSLRIRQDLTYFAQSRHRSNQLSFLRQIQDSLEGRFAELGLVIAKQEEMYQNYEAVNITGIQGGADHPRRQYVVNAHYDGVPNTPGADDNMSGVVGFLEAARLLSPHPVSKGIRYVGFDLEEEGLIGSFAYVNSGGWGVEDTIDGAFNLEMIGYYDTAPNTQTFPAGFDQLFPTAYNASASDGFRGNFLANIANQASDPLRMAFDQAAAQYVPDLKVISLAVPGNGMIAPDLRRSDHASFWDAGIPALMLTDASEFRNPLYHTVNDTVGSLNMTFLARNVQATVATLAELAGLLHGDQIVSEIDLQATNIPDLLVECQPLTWHDPIQETIILQLACPQRNAQLRLFDLAGQMVAESAIPAFGERQSLSVAGLAKGLYLIQLQSPEGRFVKKVLLQ
ncbi:MAG: M28 family peptidase [Bacteroidota bacterium]